MRSLLTLVSFLFAACGHGDATVNEESRSLSLMTGVTEQTAGDHLRVEVTQTEAPDALASDSSVDVPFEIRLTNESDEALTLKRLTLQSLGEGPYRLRTRTRTYDVTIDPGAESSVTFWSRATVLSGRSTRRPITVRLLAEYERGPALLKDQFVTRVNGRFSIGGDFD